MCGWEPPPPIRECLAHAAARCGVSSRTLGRLLDASLVHGERGTGSGRVRLVDVASVERYIATPPRPWRQPGALVPVREAAAALNIRYKLVLQWASKGELPATAYDPQQARRGRQVCLEDLKELITAKLTVECAWCGSVTVRDELPRGKERRFCPPPARCASLWHSCHRVRH